MEPLRQSDFQAVLRLVRDCYSIRDLNFEQFIQRLVNSLSQLIPAAHITYNEMYPLKSESHNCVNTAELASSHAATLWEQHMNEHPVMVHVLKTGDRQAIRISDFWSRRQLHDRGLHYDFYRHYGIEDALCITVPSRLPRVIGIGWHDDRIFTDREKQIAEIVRPHLGRAWRNARTAERLRRQLKTLKDGVESLGAGVIMCDVNGRVRFMNALAHRYLRNYFGVMRNLDHALPDTLLRWMKSQAAQLWDPKHSDLSTPAVRPDFLCEHANGRLAIRVLSRNGTHMLLMEEASNVSRNDSLARFGLTPREREVLEWIGQGKTNGEIALILNASVGTVKKHAEHVFMKLGVETRTAAAAVVLNSGSFAKA